MPEAGTYQLGLTWGGPVQAQYGLTWSPNRLAVPNISPLALLGGLGTMLVGLGFVIYARWRHLGWKYPSRYGGMDRDGRAQIRLGHSNQFRYPMMG